MSAWRMGATAVVPLSAGRTSTRIIHVDFAKCAKVVRESGAAVDG